jgi:hypothetical protein
MNSRSVFLTNIFFLFVDSLFSEILKGNINPSYYSSLEWSVASNYKITANRYLLLLFGVFNLYSQSKLDVISSADSG